MKKTSANYKFANIWLFALIADLVLISLGLFAIITGYGGDNKQPIVVATLGIATIGLIYSLFGAKLLAKKSEFAARYLQLLFPLVGSGLIAFYGGGSGSSWYLALLLMLIVCATLGYSALYIDLFVVSAFLLFDIFFNMFINSSGQFQFKTFPVTLGALLCAWLVAYSAEQTKKASSRAEQIGTELSSAQLSEKIMLSAMADPVIGIDKFKKILLMNRAAQEISGWDIGDALGIKLNQVFKLIDSKGTQISEDTDPFNTAISQNKIVKTNSLGMLRSKDSKKIALSISIAPTRNFEGQVSGAIAIIQDISEQQAIDREKSEFVSTASHEMRTPVAAIEGFLSMAMNPKIASIDDRAKGYLEKAHEASLHLGKLFQDLLSSTKIDDKEAMPARKAVNLSDVVLKTAAQLEPLASSKNLKLTTHIGGSMMHDRKVVAPAFMVMADEGRLGEVMTNLIDNAIKYTQHGSIDIEIAKEDDAVRVSVEDTGVGISTNEQKHIFEKFYRVNNSYTREQSGTGLGLYITRNIVELYGGKIWVESAPAKGSKFIFKMPLTKNVA